MSAGQTLTASQQGVESGALTRPSRLEEMKATAEAIAVYRKIASTQNTPLLMIAVNAISHSYTDVFDRSEYNLAMWIFNAFRQIRIWTLRGEPIRDAANPDKKVFPDKWIRDWGPVSLDIDGTTQWFSQQSERGDLVIPELAREFETPLHAPEWIPVQGNFMITRNGVCALAVKDDSFAHEIQGADAPAADQVDDAYMKSMFGCKTVIRLPPLPMERLGHIDLFAKFLDDHTVAVASYTDSRVQVRRLQKVSSETGEDLEGSLTAVEPQPVTLEEFENRIWSQYPKHRFLTDSLWSKLPKFSDFDLPAHADRVAARFANAGFQVVRIENPRPVITLTRREGAQKDPPEVVAHVAFPTYLNALVANGKAYVPAYDHWGSSELNEKALTAFRSAGYEAFSLPSDFLILQGGTIHCITRDVH